MSSITAGTLPRARARSRRRGWYLFDPPNFFFVTVVVAGLIWSATVPWPNRAVALVMAALIDLATLFVTTLYRRDRVLPVFEIGSVWAAAAFMYAFYPLVNYVAGGWAWTPAADFRLLQKATTPELLAAFASRYVVYFGCFTVAYLAYRGRRFVRHVPLDPPGRARMTSVLLMFVGILGTLMVIGRVYGIDYDPSYAQMMAGQTQTIVTLPYWLLQIVHNLSSIRFFLEQIILLIIIIRWRRRAWRWFLIAFLSIYLVYTAAHGGARTEVVLLVFTAVFLYHRFVRPFRVAVMIPVAALALGSFLALGIVRDFAGYDSFRSLDSPALSGANEFSAVFGTSFDLWSMRRDGTITRVPWQIFVSDFYYLVPSQLLPFQKIDPSEWYLRQAGIEGIGLMFGALGQSVLGLDWPDIALRGIVVGLAAAALHRWYVRRAAHFWPTLLYLFVTVTAYYSLRQTAFSQLYFVVYWFLPAMAGIELLTFILQRGSAHLRQLGRGAAA